MRWRSCDERSIALRRRRRLIAHETSDSEVVEQEAIMMFVLPGGTTYYGRSPTDETHIGFDVTDGTMPVKPQSA